MDRTRLFLNLGPAIAEVRLFGLPSDILGPSVERSTTNRCDLRVDIHAAGGSPDGPPEGAVGLNTPFFSGFWDAASTSACVTLTAMDAELCAPARQCHGVLRLLLSTWIRERGGIVLHGAALIHRGGAHIFLGASGAGKTTLARRFPEGHRLGDDYIALLPDGEGRFRVHGTSLRGRERLAGSLGSHPLDSIAILEQSSDPSREILGASSALPQVLRHAFAHHQCTEERSDHLATALAIVQVVPVSRLGMTRTSDPFIQAVRP